MKTIEEKIAVMTAFKEGKEIEFLDDGKWLLTSNPAWDWAYRDYRVKPEPKYRPYANAEECYKDVVKHGGWVISGNEHYKKICSIYKDTVKLFDYAVVKPFCEMLSYTWADDGTPCGVLEE